MAMPLADALIAVGFTGTALQAALALHKERDDMNAARCGSLTLNFGPDGAVLAERKYQARYDRETLKTYGATPLS